MDPAKLQDTAFLLSCFKVATKERDAALADVARLEKALVRVEPAALIWDMESDRYFCAICKQLRRKGNCDHKPDCPFALLAKHPETPDG